MNRNIVLGIVGIAISLMVVATVLVPIVSDASDDTRTVFNNNIGIYAMSTGDNLTFSYDAGIFSVNGEVASNNGYAQYVISDAISLKGSGSSVSVTYKNAEGESASFFTEAFTATVEGNVLTMTYSSGDLTVPFNWLYHVSISGDYRLADLNNNVIRSPYLNSFNDLVILSNRVPNSFVTIRDGVLDSTTEGVSFNYTVEKIAGYDDLISIQLSNNLADSDLSFTYEGETYAASACLFPYEVVAHKQGLTLVDELYLMIPVLVIVSILLVAVRIFFNHKY